MAAKLGPFFATGGVKNGAGNRSIFGTEIWKTFRLSMEKFVFGSRGAAAPGRALLRPANVAVPA